MHLEAHAGVGWLIGCGAPQTDRSLRNWCLAAAVAPDLDAVTYVFGPQVYGRWHHVLGHSVFVGLALMAAAWWHQRARGARRAALVSGLVALSFAAHLLGDAKLSAYAIKLFWPFSDSEYEFTPNLGLVSPINTWLVYASFVSVVLLALWRRVTPIDVFSPRLDRIITNALRMPSAVRAFTATCAPSPPITSATPAVSRHACVTHAWNRALLYAVRAARRKRPCRSRPEDACGDTFGLFVIHDGSPPRPVNGRCPRGLDSLGRGGTRGEFRD